MAASKSERMYKMKTVRKLPASVYKEPSYEPFMNKSATHPELAA